ncbi:hypothetical protein ABKN59_005041 [Abortiporus biennis]
MASKFFAIGIHTIEKHEVHYRSQPSRAVTSTIFPSQSCPTRKTKYFWQFPPNLILTLLHRLVSPPLHNLCTRRPRLPYGNNGRGIGAVDHGNRPIEKGSSNGRSRTKRIKLDEHSIDVEFSFPCRIYQVIE